MSWTADAPGDEFVGHDVAHALAAERRGDCPERLTDVRLPIGAFYCSRDFGHPGRHMAEATGGMVFAAWPGDTRPTVADLAAVPS